MRLRDSIKGEGEKGDIYHLLSIFLVLLISLVAWVVQEYRESKKERFTVSQFLPILQGVDIKAKQIPTYAHQTVIESSFSTHTPFSVPTNICINSVDSATLEALPVFGPVLASRTIKFRNALGGFNSIDQLSEVYGVDSLDYQRVKKWFTIDHSLVNKICLNSTSLIELRSHPYIDYKLSKLISRYVEHNQFRDVEEMESQPFMGSERWKKIGPYMKICEND